MSVPSVEQLAEALLALERSASLDRARQADGLALRLLWALAAGERAGLPLSHEQRRLVYRAIAAYEAIRGV